MENLSWLCLRGSMTMEKESGISGVAGGEGGDEPGLVAAFRGVCPSPPEASYRNTVLLMS